MARLPRLLCWLATLVSLTVLACGARTDLVDLTADPTAGSAGSAGSAGAAGVAGSAGSAGQTADRVEQLVAGYHFTCARYLSGRVACWGFNQYGQLGDGTSTSRAAPADVPGLTDATFLAAGTHRTCAVREGGTVSCWGTTPTGASWLLPQQEGGVSGVSRLAVSGAHSCAIGVDGEVRCWGAGTQGQLGGGSPVDFNATPMLVPGMLGAEQIATGENFSCARREGAIWCWGTNDRLRAGGSPVEPMLLAPTEVRGIDSAIDLSLGLTHGCAATLAGEARCWGENLQRSLGYPTPGCCQDTAKPAEGLSGAIEVGASYSLSCALRSDRTVFCWGSNSLGQLGSDAPTKSPPVQVQQLSDATHLAVGEYHACALRASGAVVCWGSNSAGALGPKANEKKSSLPVEALPPL